MIPRRFALAFAASLALATAAFATTQVRVATYNVESLNFGSGGYTALVSVLQRVDADVVLLEEIANSTEASQVATLAAATGYAHFVVGATHGTLTGNLRNAVLSRFPIAASASLGAAQISPDPLANDITRDIVRAEITVPEACAPLGVFAVHLKSGNLSTDSFRRAVEIRRLEMAIESWAALHPGATIVLGGDFNEDVFDGPFGQSWSSLPSGLPGTYHLGSDIAFPVVYDPFVKIGQIVQTVGPGLVFADATHEDCTTCYATRASSGRRLDYLWARPATLELGDEVYASPKDDGVDNAPLGNWLYKAGGVLSSITSDAASDHYAVFADYLLESCDGARYGSGSPGDHLLIPRAGIQGTAKPGNAAFGLRLRYARPSTPVILVLGQQKLLPPGGLSTDPYVPGAFLHVDLVSAFGLFPLATDADGNAALNLPLPNAAMLIGQHFDSQWFVSDAKAPNAVGAMSDAYEVVVHG